MKKLLISLSVITLAAIVWAQNAAPYDVWFRWKLNPSEEAVTSYVIEQAKVSPYTNFVPLVTVPATTNVAVVKGQTTGFAKYRIVAKNAVGVGLPSNEVSWPVSSPSATTNFSIIPKP